MTDTIQDELVARAWQLVEYIAGKSPNADVKNVLYNRILQALRDVDAAARREERKKCAHQARMIASLREAHYKERADFNPRLLGEAAGAFQVAQHLAGEYDYLRGKPTDPPAAAEDEEHAPGEHAPPSEPEMPH